MQKITDGFMFDLDGTLFLEDKVLPGAVEILHYLKSKNSPYCIMTNNSSLSRKDYLIKLQRLKLEVSAEQVLTSGVATLKYLQNREISSVFLLGTPSLKEEFRQAGFNLTDVEDEVEAVVLAFDKSLDFEKMCIAHKLLMKPDIKYFATHPDIVCPMKNGTIPDCGAMIALFAASTGRKPEIIGKPYATMVAMAAELLGVAVKNLMIVGDRVYTDMQMGFDAGCKTALVLSGESTIETLRTVPRKPDYVVENVAVLLEKLKGE